MLLATGGGLHYRRAKAAVAEGRLGVSYYLKGNDHIVVVDEPGRQLCVNGDVFAFDQVKNLTTQSDGRQHRFGICPDQRSQPRSQRRPLYADDLKVAFERVGNSLGLK